jgi:DNA-binding GntR family transcriptional regulator
MPRLAERNQDNFRAHTTIFEAILMRDPDAAEAAMKLHLNAAWKQVRETFGDI